MKRQLTEAERQVARNEALGRGSGRTTTNGQRPSCGRHSIALRKSALLSAKAALFEALKSHLSPSLEEAVPYARVVGAITTASRDAAQRGGEITRSLRRDSARGNPRDGERSGRSG